MLNIDLHCHSTVSDGLLSPADVATRAHNNGVDVWALTDHDEIGGISVARATAKELGMRHVAGVEISITWAGHTIHIVGLQIDETNPQLVQGLYDTRHGREKRAQQIGEMLAEVGIPNAYQGALHYVGNPDLISRTHFARYLVESGTCRDISDVFKNYLVEGKPGYVEHRWASLKDALTWIKGAGGVAVVAHPGRYDLTQLEMSAFLDEFKQYGGLGIEVVTGSHTPDQYAEYAKIAQQYGFLASRGSDFHGPGESKTELGALPPLPGNLVPVWHDWF
ncbi:3',5'-nucleoside bisphosphate phosphatase [Solimicrobium silvestre]|uniref:Putative metal-dependent phosphoesterases (PHP family) n=1 Tax=Solimicrobium silvestre TaxID=2099400 RepID=A0A2S9GSJ7_9BURK|nr:3',5'-nucleoside bisphosphate phosphatase [Solimicrobium silvestre]PRC90694.1 putative metal-dependent phosphoesterases (PHP family) [Solimicrobium silvestre]